ncbi:MAG: hypothetical protein GAK28_01237 [Luteibacter sp.]|uniref:DUF6624 domain-containing protein n=1 Tax=Luteibacter sp. TaxID=1886636 RepID=UPI001382B19E|nr:DUF6624 domain-containing protein [Luteibacter sp.]KAF1008257.1 MAG: hypothetical protein GAK28_01237 [Luteibacter sp.]
MNRMFARFAVTAVMTAMVAIPLKARAEDGRNTSLQDMLAKPCPTAAQWMKIREKQALSERETAPVAKPLDMALYDELVRMRAEDRRVRTPLQEGGEHPSSAVIQAVMDVDKRNLSRLRDITAHGLPTREAIGSDGQAALFILIQHADMDPALQARLLAENEKMGSKGFEPGDVAMLSDRVALRLGKEQPYGSQLWYVNGHLAPKKPVGQLDAVEKRRQSVNLMPLSDYICMMEVLQKPR